MHETPAIAGNMEGQYREKLHLGQEVEIVTKRDQKTGRLTRGRIRWILTSKPFHSRGIKVMLDDRTVGRVQKLISDENQDGS